MDISSTFMMAQNAEVSQPPLFPFPVSLFVIFCVIAVVLFVWRFVVQQKPYQIIMAIAVPLALIICVSSNKTIFYLVGIAEVILLLSAFVSSIVYNKKHPETTPEEKKEDSVEETKEEDTPEADTDAKEEENEEDEKE